MPEENLAGAVKKAIAAALSEKCRLKAGGECVKYARVALDAALEAGCLLPEDARKAEQVAETYRRAWEDDSKIIVTLREQLRAHRLAKGPNWDMAIHCACGERFTSRCEWALHAARELDAL